MRLSKLLFDQTEPHFFAIKDIFNDGCTLRWALKHEIGCQRLCSDVILVRLNRGAEACRGLDKQVNSVSDIQLSALAQILHAADNFACPTFPHKLRRQLGDQQYRGAAALTQ